MTVNPPPEAPTEDHALARLPGPVAILGSRAGWGNRVVGRTMAGRLGPAAAYRDVEELLAPGLVRRHLHRHRWLCRHAPRVLGALERWPRRRIRDRDRAIRAVPDGLEGLEGWLRQGGFRSAMATSHRAALWVARLRRHRRLDLVLVGVLTDYAWSSGWRFLPWSELHRVQAPVEPPPEVPARLWRRGPIPTDGAGGSGAAPEPDRILVAGGGWGLGPIARAVGTILDRTELAVDAACGENGALRRRLELRARRSGGRLRVHGPVASLLPLMERAAGVVTKPGGVTLAEAAGLGRPILLLPARCRPDRAGAGSAGTERANARHARRHLGARDFSLPALREALR